MTDDTDDIFAGIGPSGADGLDLRRTLERVAGRSKDKINKTVYPPVVEQLDSEPTIEESSSIILRPEPPKTGASILMPSRGVASGVAAWEELRSDSSSLKISRGLRAGLVKKSRYPQPIDIIIPYAGSEATGANEENGVEDGIGLGMLARQISTANRIQQAVGSVTNTIGEPQKERPVGVAIASTLSDDDHEKQIGEKALNKHETKLAVAKAAENRISSAGALRPSVTDELGRVVMSTVGEGISLLTMRTGKVGGGKSLTAYSTTSPRDSIDRQASGWKIAHQLLESSEKPVVLPPVMSIGGTSFDAHLHWFEGTRNYIPPGAFQYITTQPQDTLEHDIAAAASRKKLESVAALTCIDSGDIINEIPIVMIDHSNDANAKFVESEQLRLAMESYGGLQPCLSLDRSDVVVKLNEHSAALGKGCRESELFIANSENPNDGERLKIQYRDVYLAHATHMNRSKITRIATGQESPTAVNGDIQYLVTRSFAQVYGRNVADLMLSDVELHRMKIKMVQVVIYLPDDLEMGKRKEMLRRLQNSVSAALDNVLGSEYKLPQFTTSYRIPMTGKEQPLIALRLMTHTKDIVDLITNDTPELSERILTGLSIQEAKEKKRGRTKMLENKIWHAEIASLESSRHRGIPFFTKWAAILKVLVQRAYKKGWQPVRKDAWGNGPRNQ